MERLEPLVIAPGIAGHGGISRLLCAVVSARDGLVPGEPPLVWALNNEEGGHSLGRNVTIRCAHGHRVRIVYWSMAQGLRSHEVCSVLIHDPYLTQLALFVAPVREEESFGTLVLKVETVDFRRWLTPAEESPNSSSAARPASLAGVANGPAHSRSFDIVWIIAKRGVLRGTSPAFSHRRIVRTPEKPSPARGKGFTGPVKEVP